MSRFECIWNVTLIRALHKREYLMLIFLISHGVIDDTFSYFSSRWFR